jgi:hypothetical protein
MRKSKTYTCTWKCRCGLRFSVLGNDPDLHLLPKRFKCLSPKTCRYYMVRNDKLKQGPTVRGLDLYKTHCGLGRPSERKCGKVELKKLVGKKLIGMSLETTSDKDRSIINSFTLEGGITVHLAPSVRGVTVFKVIRE